MPPKDKDKDKDTGQDKDKGQDHDNGQGNDKDKDKDDEDGDDDADKAKPKPITIRAQTAFVRVRPVNGIPHTEQPPPEWPCILRTKVPGHDWTQVQTRAHAFVRTRFDLGADEYCIVFDACDTFGDFSDAAGDSNVKIRSSIQVFGAIDYTVGP